MITVVEGELTHYRVPVYRRLQERLAEPIVVYHTRPAPGSGLKTVEPGEDVGFPHEILPGTWLANGRLHVTNPFRVLRRDSRAAILRHSVRDPTFLPLMMALRARGTRVVVWGQGYSRNRPFRPDRRPSDRLHLLIVRASDAYVCYTEAIRAALARHIPADKLFVARNTLDTGRLSGLRRELERAGTASIRSELELDPLGVYASFIGRLQARKRPEVLLEAQRLLRDEGIRLEALFIGDGPLRPALEARASELGLEDSAHFLGERYGDEAARYLFASDVMAMPGWLGLAVVHAFAMGVPVVSQLTGKPDLIGHPPEAAYVRDGVNGQMAEPGGPREFAAALKSVLAERARLGRGAAEFADRELSLDGMVDGFVAAISHATG